MMSWSKRYIMKYSIFKTMFWANLFLLVLIGYNLTLAVDEDINITTWYPAPMGVYANITVEEKMDIRQEMKLGEDSELSSKGGQIYKSGSFYPKQITGDIGVDMFIKELDSRELYVSGTLTNMGEEKPGVWTLGDWHTVEGTSINWTDFFFGFFSLFANERGTATCGDDSFINNIRVRSAISPQCLILPINPPLAVGICVGREQFEVDYRCITKVD